MINLIECFFKKINENRAYLVTFINAFKQCVNNINFISAVIQDWCFRNTDCVFCSKPVVSRYICF